MADKDAQAPEHEIEAMDTAADVPQTEVPLVRSPEWPRDPHGFTSAFRREVARAVGRIRGNDEKMEIFMAHLRAAGKWAKERHEIQKDVKSRAFEEAKTRAEEAQGKADIEAEERTAKAPQETAAQAAMRQANAGVGGATVAQKG